MAKAKVTQVSVSGLATNPNPNGLPAGSCAVAENVVSRRPGVLTPCPTSTALATIDSINFTTGKGLWSDADNAVIAVLPQNVDANAWVPGTDETQIGELVCYTVNQTAGAVAEWELTELPIGVNAVNPNITTYRDVGFIPGITHATYNTFRTIITEKWGNIASSGTSRRWAGLLPPLLRASDIPTSTAAAWFIENNSVLYRAHFALESTDTDKPFSVIGPVSNVVAVGNFDVSADGVVFINIPILNYEPYPFSTSDYTLYAYVYRSTQDDVESPTDLPYDFRLIKKVEVTQANLVAGAVGFTDIASDDARNEGALLYTNPEQEGEDNSSYCPPSARDVAVFRNTAFYANRSFLPALKVTVTGPALYHSTTGLFSDNDKRNGIGTRALTGTGTNGSAIITGISASNMLGLVVGQQVHIIGNVSGEIRGTITARTASTITLSTTWTPATQAVHGYSYDTYTLKVFYADGTDDTFVFNYSNNVLNGDFCPGFRVLGPFLDYELPVEGRANIFVYTYPAIKRMKYFELYLTNGQNYSPPYTGTYASLTSPLISVVETRPNRLFFSKNGQPEEVPLTNYIDVGAGTILKMWATQSALLVLCTDGLWRVTGDATPWQVNQVDPTVTLLHPDCLGSLNNQIYGWVEDGLALIGEDGAQTISTDAVGPDIREWATTIKGWGAPYFWGPCVMGDRFWNEVWLNVYRAHSAAHEFESVTTLVYNTDTKNFTRLQRPFFSSLQYSPDANRMISQVFIPDSPANHIALTVQSDFYDPAGDGWLPATVWFNALQTDDKGKLKQWMDVNYFVANVETTVGSDTSYMHGLFDARNESTDPYEDTFSVNIKSMVELSRDVHFWIPRRAALSDQMQLGVQFVVLDEDDTLVDGIGFDFQLQGFTVRYRNASDTLKR